MGFRHAHNMKIIFIIVFVASSTSQPFLSDDSPFSDTELLSDDQLLAYNSPGASVSLFSDTNNSDLFSSTNDDLNLDEPFELADCSSFEDLKDSPDISKSRIRRNDSRCPNPGVGAEPFKSEFEFSGQGSVWVWGDEGIHERRNGQCQIMTAGALPWGVCYQPTGSPLNPVGTSVVPPNSGREVPAFLLGSCALGTFAIKIEWIVDWLHTAPGDTVSCPATWEFYCCVAYIPIITRGVDPLLSGNTGEGFGCVGLPTLELGNGPFDP